MARKAASETAGASASAPSATLGTPDGYKPPSRSKKLLEGVPFHLAQRVGDKYTARFERWDATKAGKNDPSLCRGLYQFPSDVLFWESKMAASASVGGTSEEKQVPWYAGHSSAPLAILFF